MGQNPVRFSSAPGQGLAEECRVGDATTKSFWSSPVRRPSETIGLDLLRLESVDRACSSLSSRVFARTQPRMGYQEPSLASDGERRRSGVTFCRLPVRILNEQSVPPLGFPTRALRVPRASGKAAEDSAGCGCSGHTRIQAAPLKSAKSANVARYNATRQSAPRASAPATMANGFAGKSPFRACAFPIRRPRASSTAVRHHRARFLTEGP